ncbi:MAG: OmpA family protein [Verrucomicrobiae bacterium]|nr:OmpA family protein [Verrucomicrobiae bacterium]
MKTCPSSIRFPALALAALLGCAAIVSPVSAADKPAPVTEKQKPKRPQQPPRKREELPRMRQLREQLEKTSAELELARDSLHEAQKELGAKAETISSLEAKLSSVSEQLKKAQADLKASGTAAADLARRERELDTEKKKVAALQEELKAVQKKAADAVAKAKADAQKKITVVVTSSAGGTVSVGKPKAAPAAKPVVIAPVAYDKGWAVNYPERDRALGQVRAALKQHPNAKVQITGFADDSRYSETNQEISENRANYLAAYFAIKGVPEDRLQTRGLGNSRPVKAQPNRRAEILIRP